MNPEHPNPKDIFKPKKARKTQAGPKGKRPLPDYLRKPKLTTKRQRSAQQPKAPAYSQGGTKPNPDPNLNPNPNPTRKVARNRRPGPSSSPVSPSLRP